MGKLSDEAKKKIQLIKFDAIQTLLFRFLNEDAKMEHDLFCSAPDQKRFFKFGLFSPFLFKDEISRVKDEAILTIVFLHAPDTLCLELIDILIDLDVETSISLLQSDCISDLSPIIAIFEQSPDYMQKKISSWIASLSFARRARLFGQDFLLKHIIYNDEESSIWRLQGLHHLEPQTIRDFFYQGWRWEPLLLLQGYTGYGGLVELFRDHRISTDIAIELLSLLERLNHEDLYMLFRGKTTSMNMYEKNLLYVLFEQYPKPVIDKALQLAQQQLTCDEIDALLFFNTATRNTNSPYEIINPYRHASALYNAFGCSNKLDATSSIIELMGRKPILKQLLVQKSPFWLGNKCPMESAVKYENKEAVAYFLEQIELESHLEEKVLTPYYESVLALAKKYKSKCILELFEAYRIYRVIYSKYESNDLRLQALNAFIPIIKENPQLLTIKWTNEKTLLHHAARVGGTLAISFLIKLGVDINAKDIKGKTPLDEALASGHSIAVQSLLSKKQEKHSFSDMDEADLITLIALVQSAPNSFSKLISNLSTQSNSKIKRLDLSHFEFTKQGFTTFLPLLRLLPQLHTLKLKGCHLKGDDIEQLALLLAEMPALTTLDLDNNLLVKTDVVNLLRKLEIKFSRSNLVELSLRSNLIHIRSLADMNALQNHKPDLVPLKTIHLNGNTVVEENLANRLKYKKLLSNVHVIISLLRDKEPTLTIKEFLESTFIASKYSGSEKVITLELGDTYHRRRIELSLSGAESANYNFLRYDDKNIEVRPTDKDIFDYLKSGINHSSQNHGTLLSTDERARRKQLKEFYSVHPDTNMKGLFNRQQLFFTKRESALPSLLFPEIYLTKKRIQKQGKTLVKVVFIYASIMEMINGYQSLDLKLSMRY
ncbi:hypothetical protein LDG_6861 [Legionella drancourtii LLAP12]|uniref:Uncharacterized protein n=2 Tax=Legionella drancourtii TaxID=168933 RepID=G9ENN6_9GAMM|nr:hypothetical protein LDG_6861 [Legionella drancourtii LLAP12]